ncbi:hypothetical protein ACINB_07650 [Acidovorax sp. NB1]|nr:hypothetical protein ACINB_07650 [Acidovorax sp. NB1]
MLAGCATAPTQPDVAPVTTPHAVDAAAVPTMAQPTPLAAESDEPTTPPKDLLRDTLAYADRTLSASTSDLARETARLSDLDESKPSRALRLALVLAQTRQPVDTARALGLVQRTLANPAAQDLHPLARLLEARLTQQRRLEEQLDRQAQQLRDAQRRNEQLADRLEAVRAIERSLTTRPAPAAASPGAGSNNGNGSAKP